MNDSSMAPGNRELDAAIAEITRIQLGMMKRRGEGQRGQHYKQQACLKARFQVLTDIPERYKVGLFAWPTTYNAIIRFSNGRRADDTQPDVHGMALKLLRVPGDKILEAEASATTHDFILADNPVFIIRDTLEYLRFMREFDGGEPLFGIPFKFLFWLLFNHPADLSVLMKFDKHLHDSLLMANFFSQTPYAFGANRGTICRYGVRPAAGNMIAPIPAGAREAGYLRRAMVDHLSVAGKEAVFDFTAQILENASPDIIDNPTIVWDAPEMTIARITIPPQVFDTPQRDEYGESLSFTPWHALPDHRPLGQINNIRKAVYLASSSLRHDVNGKPREEPTGDLM